MRKKFLSMLLVLVTLTGNLTVYAENDIAVYLSVSKYAELVKDKNGMDMAYAKVVMSGKDSYTIDDVFVNAHEMYYDDGADGYASSESEWGLGVDKLWGDTSYNFGYQVNGGSVSVMGPGHVVADGDFIDAVIYKNLYPDTESYSCFDKFMIELDKDDELELTLSYVGGYDEDWNSIILPCNDAIITVNNEETEMLTDESGKVFISFDKAGEYIISAKKNKFLNDKEVPAITAPVCVVTVKEKPYVTMLNNLVEKYSSMDFEDAGGNLPWIVADLAVYEELYGKVLSENRKKEAASLIVGNIKEPAKPGDLAKSIIALTALGYDPRSITTKDYDSIDLVKMLTVLLNEGEEAVTNIYTLPYVIIALMQNEEYITNAEKDFLLQAVFDNKEKWQDTQDGTDAMTPMVLALSKFYDDENVKTVVDETVEIIKSQQREDGLIDGFEGYEPASTALAICALSSLGIDPDDVKKDGNSLIDGLFSTANENLDSFPNAFADEQGLRALLSWMLLEENAGKTMYDFSHVKVEKLNIPDISYCPVIFNVNPSDAAITISGGEIMGNNSFDLAEGKYQYTVFAYGYETVSGEIEVTSEEAQNHTKKIIDIVLDAEHSGGGGGASHGKDKEDVRDNVIEDVDKAETEIIEDTVEIPFSDVSKNDWYYSAVSYVYSNNLFSGTDKGFEPDLPMSRAMLVVVLHRLSGGEKVRTEVPFTDVEDSWYIDAVKWAVENGIVSGVTDTEFAPDDSITREQMATMIYRYANKYSDTVSDVNVEEELRFKDCEEISSYAVNAIRYALGCRILSGRGDGMLYPKENTTRAEVASLLMRFVEGTK